MLFQTVVNVLFPIFIFAGWAISLSLLAIMIRDTRRRRGKWGLNLRRIVCPRCNVLQPVYRFPTSLRQAWWGGCTCKNCGIEMDRWGMEVIGGDLPANKIPAGIKIFISVLVIALLTSLGFLTHAIWLNFFWKQEVQALAGYEGSTRASHDFQNGKLRLFVIAGELDEDKFSGTNEGVFQVWFPQYYADPYPIRRSIEWQLESYNRKMRYMYEHPEKFSATTNSIKK